MTFIKDITSFIGDEILQPILDPGADERAAGMAMQQDAAKRLRDYTFNGNASDLPATWQTQVKPSELQYLTDIQLGGPTLLPGAEKLRGSVGDVRAGQIYPNMPQEAATLRPDYVHSTAAQIAPNERVTSALGGVYADQGAVDAQGRALSGMGDLAGRADMRADPVAVAAQRQALASMAEMAGGGMTASDRARLADSQRMQAQFLRGQREADLADAERRGMSMGGATLASRLAAQQQSANMLGQSEEAAQAAAQDRAAYAQQAMGQMAGAMRGQDFGEQLTNRQNSMAAQQALATMAGQQRAQGFGEGVTRAQGTDAANLFNATNQNALNLNQASLNQQAQLDDAARNTSFNQWVEQQRADRASRETDRAINAQMSDADRQLGADTFNATQDYNAGAFDIGNQQAVNQYNTGTTNQWNYDQWQADRQRDAANAGIYNDATYNVADDYWKRWDAQFGKETAASNAQIGVGTNAARAGEQESQNRSNQLLGGASLVAAAL